LPAPIFLLVFALNIAQQSSGWFTATDLAYFLVLAGMFQCHDRDGRTGLPTDCVVML
jgi:hypothetical protein